MGKPTSLIIQLVVAAIIICLYGLPLQAVKKKCKGSLTATENLIGADPHSIFLGRLRSPIINQYNKNFLRYTLAGPKIKSLFHIYNPSILPVSIVSLDWSNSNFSQHLESIKVLVKLSSSEFQSHWNSYSEQLIKGEKLFFLTKNGKSGRLIFIDGQLDLRTQILPMTQNEFESFFIDISTNLEPTLARELNYQARFARSQTFLNFRLLEAISYHHLFSSNLASLFGAATIPNFLNLTLDKIRKYYSANLNDSEFIYLWQRMTYSLLGTLAGNSSLYRESGNTRSPWPINHDKLRIMNWNIMRFQIETSKVEADGKKAVAIATKISPIQKEELQRVSSLINSFNADFIILQEADLPSIKYFVKTNLRGKYRVEGIPGNTKFGIVLLIKDSLPLYVKIISHRQDKFSDKGGPLFTQDLPVFLIFRNRPENSGSVPELIIVGTHFKSLPSPLESSSYAANQNMAQRSRTVEVIHKLTETFSAETPIILAGDLNIRVDSDSAKEFIANAGLLNPRKSLQDRNTHWYLKDNKLNFEEIDGIFLNSNANNLLVSVYSSSWDNSVDLINTKDSILFLSDHLPLYLDFKTPRSFKK